MGAGLRITRFILGLAGLFTLGFVAFSALDGEAGAWSPRGFEATAPQASIATPVKVFRDCQEIARCTGCRPVYKCRSCKYQKVCGRRGFCEWRDVCVWSPYMKVLPQGARIIRLR